MATYESKRQDFSRTPVWYVKLILGFCSNTFGSAPCTAIGTGDQKCVNTYPSCKDRTNFTATTKTYKYCSDGELPFSEGERPYVAGVTLLPTEIKNSIPALGRIRVRMLDEPESSDIGLDPYATERTGTRGTYWRKFLKRNPNYKGRIIEVYEGFIGIPESEFQLRFRGRIENISYSGNMIDVEGIDFIGDLKRVKIPTEYDIKLAGSVSTADTTFTFTGNDVDRLSGDTSTSVSVVSGATYYLRMGDELMSYLSSNYDSTSNQITGISRGIQFTPIETGAENDDIAVVPHYSGNIFDVMHSLLVNSASRIDTPGAGISTVYVNTTKYEAERDFSVGATEVTIDGWLDETVSVDEPYFDLVNLIDAKSWVGEDLKITVDRRIPNRPNRTYRKITDDANIVIKSDNYNNNQMSRFTRAYLLWGYLPNTDYDKGKNFRRRTALIDLDLESTNFYGEQITQIDKTRLFRAGIMSEAEQDRFVNNRQRRWVNLRQDGLPLIDVTLEYKDSDIKTGDFVRVNTDLLCDILGNTESSATCQVIKRDISDNKVKLRLEVQRVNKTAFIGETTSSGGSSFSTAASESQSNYAFISAADSASSTGAVLPDGAPAYLIY